MRKDDRFNYRKPKDLFGKTIGIRLGFGYGVLDEHFASGQIKSHLAGDNKKLYKMLERGRVDAIIGNEHVTPYEMKQLGIDTSQYVFADVPIYEFDLMPMIHNDYKEFQDAMNAFIDQSKQNGYLDRIADKYLN